MSALLLLLALIGSGSMGTADEYCTTPERFLCSPERISERKLREDRIDGFGNIIKRRALTSVMKDFKISPLRSEKDLGKLEPADLRERARARCFRHLKRLTRMYLKGKGLAKDLNFEIVRSHMLKVADSWFGIDESTRQRMRRIIAKVKILTLDEVLFTGQQPVSMPEALAECGDDGLADNAFADEFNNENVVIVCPGAMLASVEFARVQRLPEKWIASGLMMTLAHEIGHHVDSRAFPRAYRAAESCQRQNFPALKNDVRSYMSENSADSWGAAVLGQILKSAPLELRATILEGALEDLCDSTDDGSHPDGSYRLNFLIRSSTAISAAMGCSSAVDCPGP